MSRARTTTFASKFGYLVSSVTIVTAILICVLYERSLSESTLSQATVSLDNTAEHLADELRQYIASIEQSAALLSNTPSVQGIIRGVKNNGSDPQDQSTTDQWIKRLNKTFVAAAREHSEYTQIRLLGIEKNGLEIARVNQFEKKIEVVIKEHLQFKSKRNYYQSSLGLTPGKRHISDLNLNREHGKVAKPYTPVLRVVHPIFDSKQVLWGLLVINSTIEDFFLKKAQQLPKGISLYLTNDEGDYLYHPDRTKRYGFDLGHRYQIQNDISELKISFSDHSTNGSLKFDYQATDERNKLRFLKIHFDQDNPERYMGLALTLPYSEIFSFHDQNLVKIFILVAILAMIALLTTLALLKRILHPLNDLADSAKLIADGQYDIEIPHPGSIELELLADALRQAASDVAQREGALNQLTKNLEKRVVKRTEELRHRELSLVNAQRIACLGSWDWNVAKNHLIWSSEAFKLFGLPTDRANPTYAEFIDLIHLDDRIHVDSVFRKVLKSESQFKLEYRIRRPDGEERVIHGEGEVDRDKHGHAIFLRGTVQDVTERKQSEDRLRLLASTFEHSLEGILITDKRMTIVQVNPSFSRITGYSSEEIIGKKPSFMSSDWQAESFFEEMRHTLRTTGQWQGEQTSRHKNGEIYSEWLTVCSIHDDEGKLVNYVGVFNDITEQKAAEKRISHLAYYDSLTELANRRLFENQLEHSIRMAKRNNQLIAVLYINLDRFKPINDNLGHKTGDLLLKYVATMLKDSVRENDTVARLGGDEFGIVLEDVGEAPASQISEAIIERLGNAIQLKNSEVFIGASIGISVYPNDGSDLSTLIKHADIAMYRAKDQGRNNYQFFLPEMNIGIQERHKIENALRYALDRNEFEVYYQPQVRLNDGKIVGVEALLRWDSPTLGRVPPTVFIPIAEESGLIDSIGEWVLEQACLQYKAWIPYTGTEFRVAVNLSARQFNSNVVAMVEKILKRTNMTANNLELEITEGMVMDNSERAIELLEELNGLGVQLAIDDFGTGYSSLSYLKRFPIHKLKIDRAFISDLPQNEEDAAITNAIIAMAKSLGLEVIAEGTETIKQILHLKNQGCNEVQGYYFSKPLPAKNLNKLIQSDRRLVIN